MRQTDVANVLNADDGAVVGWARLPTVPPRSFPKIRALCELLSLDSDELLASYPTVVSLQ